MWLKVLSLFDGMACGYEALLRAWIPIDKYYASEIDKYAIQVALKNHPDIIEIWDVTQVKWKSNTLTAWHLNYVYNTVIRKLTPEECEKLQTLDVGYTSGVSNSQRYKMLGNGRTVDVVSHILSFIK